MTPPPLPLNPAGALPARWQRAIVLGTLLLHALGAWALLQTAPVQRALSGLVPIAVEWIAPPAPPASPPARLASPPPAVAPRPQPHALLAAAPVALPAQPEPTAPAPRAEPQPAAAPAPEQAPAASAPQPAVPAQPAVQPQPPRTIAIAAVEYLSPPQLNYPLASRRMQEQGQVQVRVLVDAQGRPQQAAVLRSSGYPRLDEAALATVRATRFKPYTENGTPLPFWVLMPLVFELEN